MIWLVLILLVLFIILLMLTRIYVTANLICTSDNQWLEVQIKILRLSIFRKQIPLVPASPDKHYNISFTNAKDIFKKEFAIMKELTSSAKKVLSRVYFHKLIWHTEGGTGQAAGTGIIAGGVWSIKGMIVNYLSQRSNMKCKPVLKVVPHFQQQCFYTRLECIASIRIGQAIYAFVYTLKNTALKEEVVST